MQAIYGCCELFRAIHAFEGNFAVDKFKGNGNPVGAQGTEKKINLTINIEKSVNPQLQKLLTLE